MQVEVGVSDLLNVNNWQGDNDREEHRRYQAARNAYWQQLQRIKTEFTSQLGFPGDFDAWCASQYGFKPCRDEGGNFTSEVDIVDEVLYTMYLLKYTK